MKLLKQAVLSVAAAAVLCAAPLARADILGTQGFAAGSQQFGLNIGPTTVNAGGFNGTWDAQAIIFWCIELTQNFGFGNNYGDYVASLEPNDRRDDAAGPALHRGLCEPAADATYSAAFQLAIWEIVYDSGNLNLAGGSLFVKNNHGNTAAIALAQGWLDNLGKFTDDYHLILLSSPDPSGLRDVRHAVPSAAGAGAGVARPALCGAPRHGVVLRRRPRRTRA